ncbi:MAG: hypothetical protein PHO16_08935, partial [Candidatus Cloacimonetes bacterium]|nr:hypothetical protein [Candidatus Cloacimonadota bacterium]
ITSYLDVTTDGKRISVKHPKGVSCSIWITLVTGLELGCHLISVKTEFVVPRSMPKTRKGFLPLVGKSLIIIEISFLLQ